MGTPRIFVPQSLTVGDRVQLPEPAFRHVVQVLRLAPGEGLTLFNSEGGEYEAVLDAAGKREAYARIERYRGTDRESPLNITLAQGVSKGERMDYSIQKAVELGVSEVMPLLTERCVVKLSAERWDRKLEHWQNIAISACEQCGRTRVPVVLPPSDLRDWLAQAPANAHKLVLDPDAEATLQHSDPGKNIVLLVGPEGGLSPMEIKLAELAGFRGLRLGPRLLRTETAGVVALSVLQAHWGDLKK